MRNQKINNIIISINASKKHIKLIFNIHNLIIFQIYKKHKLKYIIIILTLL